jgi:dTDP-4-amino-4,6-dideoxygalactose transaminase
MIHPNASHVFHLYTVQVDQRDRILKQLQQSGIEAGIHYPIPLHEQPAYSYLRMAPDDLPITHQTAQRILSLPIYPEMTQSQIERVCGELKRALQQMAIA